MVWNHVLLAVFWMLYGILHSVLAAPAVKAWAKEKLGRNFRLYRIGYTLIAFLFFAFIIFYEITMRTVALFISPRGLLGSGVVIASAGILLMVVCIKKYFVSLSGLLTIFQENVSPVLMTGGVHRYIRHPLYLGTFLFIWGLFLILPLWSVLISNTIITVYTLIGMRLEEEKLLTQFGSDYRRYQSTVPRLFPRLKLNAGIEQGQRQK